MFAALEMLESFGGATVSVCLLLDGCTDSSVALVAAYRERSRHRIKFAQSAPAQPNAGRARHRAMLLGRHALAEAGGLLLTTDADSAPAVDWLTTMVAALDRADVVTGRIIRQGHSPCPLQERIEVYYDRLFALRRRLDLVPWEADATHHHTGGANLGMRAAAYEIAGGFLPLLTGEDARFVDEAARAGLRVRRDAACVVRTSDRRQGRVAGGLAATLQRLDHTATSAVSVSHPEDAAWQYAMHAIARRAFMEDSLELAADALGLTGDHVLGVARDAPNAAAFAMRIVPVPPGGMREVPLPAAEMALDRLITARRAA